MLKKGITPSDDLPPTGAKFMVEFGSSVAVRGWKSVMIAVLPSA